MPREYFVYIISNTYHTVLYIGVTNNVERRVWEHKFKLVKGFSSKYCLNKLLYFEQYFDVYTAISREKQLKNWKRDWKFDLIRSMNPELRDLSKDF